MGRYPNGVRLPHGRYPALSVGPPFTPATVAGLLGWWDASQEGYADGASVPSIADRSGNGWTMTQGTVAKQPTFKVTGTNGKKSFQFDGVDDGVFGSLPGGGVFNPLTIFTVFQLASISSGPCIIQNQSSSWVLYGNPAPDQWRFYDGTNLGTSIATDTNPTILSVTQDGVTSVPIYVNGVAGAFSAVLNNTGTNLVSLMSSDSATAGFTPGYLNEAIYYGNGISNANRILVTNYLKAKWGIA